MDFLISLKRQTLIMSLCYILVGLFFVLFPDTAVATIVRIIGVAAMVIGIIKIVEFFSNQKYDKPFSNSLAGGIILLILAVFLLAKPQVIVSILYVLIGAALILCGILTVQSSVDLWHYEPQRNFILLVSGVLTLILGIIVLFNPFPSAEALILASGIFLMIGGLSDLITLFRILRLIKSSDQK